MPVILSPGAQVRTALSIIEDALALTNSVGVDQTLTADEVTDCIRQLNDLIDDWSTQNLAVFGQANQTFNTVAGQSVYTIGPSGDWDTTRPVRINAPAYSSINGVTFPCVPMTQGEYNLIAVKAQTQDYPDRYLYVNDVPLGIVTLWPVPSAVTPVTLSIDRVLLNVASGASLLVFPPGYNRAFVYNLGISLASLFGKKASDYPDVWEIARTSFGNIKRANKKKVLMTCDPAYSDTGGGYVSWERGW